MALSRAKKIKLCIQIELFYFPFFLLSPYSKPKLLGERKNLLDYVKFYEGDFFGTLTK